MPKTMKEIEEMKVVVRDAKMYCAKCGAEIFLYEYGGHREASTDCTCDEKEAA